jgi:hypothetical protein
VEQGMVVALLCFLPALLTEFGLTLHVAAFVALLLAATGIIGRVEALYFCGIVVTIGEVGWTFLVQFQTERS